MTIERSLRMIAGAFVAASVLLGIYVNPQFLWFTLFVGLNLFGVYPVVSDDDDSSQGWRPRVKSIRVE
jgi:hypothetical protein